MTKQHEEKIKCAKCGEAINATVYDSIDIKENPELKEQILKNKLFKLSCDKCGYSCALNYSCFYYDSEKNLIIYNVPQRNENDDRSEIREIFDEIYPDSSIGDNCIKRIVSDVNKLADKILIFDCGLDDRVIELMKLFYYMKIYDESIPSSPENIYFEVDGQGNKNFVIVLDDGKALSSEFIQEMYNDFKNEYTEKIDANDDYEVDTAWAISILSR